MGGAGTGDAEGAYRGAGLCGRASGADSRFRRGGDWGRAAAAAEVRVAVVNVGGGSSVTMLDVLDLAHEITGRSVPVITANRQVGDVATSQADLTLARGMLGYRPTVGLREGMARHVDWLAELPDPLRSSLLSDQLEPVGK